LREYATSQACWSLGVLAMTVGLIRSETADDLRTLAAPDELSPRGDSRGQRGRA
jgi:hypothetical protein